MPSVPGPGSRGQHERIEHDRHIIRARHATAAQAGARRTMAGERAAAGRVRPGGGAGREPADAEAGAAAARRRRDVLGRAGQGPLRPRRGRRGAERLRRADLPVAPRREQPRTPGERAAAQRRGDRPGRTEPADDAAGDLTAGAGAGDHGGRAGLDAADRPDAAGRGPRLLEGPGHPGDRAAGRRMPSFVLR